MKRNWRSLSPRFTIRTMIQAWRSFYGHQAVGQQPHVIPLDRLFLKLAGHPRLWQNLSRYYPPGCDCWCRPLFECRLDWLVVWSQEPHSRQSQHPSCPPLMPEGRKRLVGSILGALAVVLARVGCRQACATPPHLLNVQLSREHDRDAPIVVHSRADDVLQNRRSGTSKPTIGPSGSPLFPLSCRSGETILPSAPNPVDSCPHRDTLIGVLVTT